MSVSAYDRTSSKEGPENDIGVVEGLKKKKNSIANPEGSFCDELCNKKVQELSKRKRGTSKNDSWPC